MLDYKRAASLGLALSVVLSARLVLAGFTVFAVGGDASPASIQPTVDAFRAALGPDNGAEPGPLTTGRRELNWDAGIHASGSANALTTFRNSHGSVFSTMGRLTQTPVDHFSFTSINPTYSTTFAAFSPTRIFTPIGSSVTDVSFYVPGSNGTTSATTSGFGVVFSDVDLPAATWVEFFDLNGSSLGLFHVPPGNTPNASFSFLGAVASAGEQIAWAQVITGNSQLGPNDGGAIDVVVMDDVIYAEPAAIPEPAHSLVLMSLVLFVSAGRATLSGCRCRLGNRGFRPQIVR